MEDEDDTAEHWGPAGQSYLKIPELVSQLLHFCRGSLSDDYYLVSVYDDEVCPADLPVFVSFKLLFRSSVGSVNTIQRDRHVCSHIHTCRAVA